MKSLPWTTARCSLLVALTVVSLAAAARADSSPAPMPRVEDYTHLGWSSPAASCNAPT